jgi:hypothetical protein
MLCVFSGAPRPRVLDVLAVLLCSWGSKGGSSFGSDVRFLLTRPPVSSTKQRVAPVRLGCSDAGRYLAQPERSENVPAWKVPNS